MIHVVKWVFVLLPTVGIFCLDRDMSSPVHVPIIGTIAICVALCDALFGQIVSCTRWIPFSGCYTPSEAQVLAKKFRTFHKKLFWLWMIVKISSSIVIVMSGIMITQTSMVWLHSYRVYILGAGYVMLGISIQMVFEFVVTYFHATDTVDEVRLREMNHAYNKEHHELYDRCEETVAQQLSGFGESYTNKVHENNNEV